MVRIYKIVDKKINIKYNIAQMIVMSMHFQLMDTPWGPWVDERTQINSDNFESASLCLRFSLLSFMQQLEEK